MNPDGEYTPCVTLPLAPSASQWDAEPRCIGRRDLLPLSPQFIPVHNVSNSRCLQQAKHSIQYTISNGLIREIFRNICKYSGTSLLRSPTGLDKNDLNGEVTVLQRVHYTVEYNLGLSEGDRNGEVTLGVHNYQHYQKRTQSTLFL